MRVLRRLAAFAAHPSNKTDALSLREEGVAFLTFGKGRAAPRRRRGRTASRPLCGGFNLEKEKTMSKTPSLPSHRVYAVTKDGKQSYWRAIGAAWPHSDGEGFFVKLEFMPLTPGAQIVIRKPKAEEPEGAEPAAV
jgi:hypothetical protein